MNEQPKSKVLIIIIGILLLANIVMLGFFIMGGQKEKKEKSNRNSYVTEYLKNEVGFNSDQLMRYDSLNKKHRELMRMLFNQLTAGRKQQFKILVAASFSDAAIDSMANDLFKQQKIVEWNTLEYVKQVRDICTALQKVRFDTGFYKIFGKHSLSHTEK